MHLYFQFAQTACRIESRTEWALCMSWSHGRKSILLDGKWFSGTSKNNGIKIWMAAPLSHYTICHPEGPFSSDNPFIIKWHGEPVAHKYLGARSRGIQQPASSDWAASSMTTKSKCSGFTSLRGPSTDALVFVAKTTSALVRISVIALSSLCLSSSRRDLISCFRCFFSDGFRDFLTFVW